MNTKNKPQEDNYKVNEDEIPAELYMLAKLKNEPGSIKLFYCFENERMFIYVTERPMPCKDLFDYVSEKGFLFEHEAQNIFNQIVNILEACLRKHIIHNDIKDENILINTKNNKITLIDFGYSAIGSSIHEPCEVFKGTRVFSTPEWFFHQSYYPINALIWSMGILLYNMLYGNIPFTTSQEILNK